MTDARKLADKIDALLDDGNEGVPWSQDELDMIATALRACAWDASMVAAAIRALADREAGKQEPTE